jgi:hypothetical protein
MVGCIKGLERQKANGKLGLKVKMTQKYWGWWPFFFSFFLFLFKKIEKRKKSS